MEKSDQMCIAGGRVEDLTATKAPHITSQSSDRTMVRRVMTHDHLFYQGDERDFIYVVQSGWVKLYRTLIDGQRQVVGFANPGSILGLESDGEHTSGCEAITAATVRAIPVSRLAEVCRQDAAFAEHILRQIGRQLGAAQAQLATVGAQSADQKLATFLLSIADLCNVSPAGDFDLPMRRGDMAEFLGLRLETISRKMSDFQRRGWITMTSLYHCRLVRREVLEDLAAGGDLEDATMLRVS